MYNVLSAQRTQIQSDPDVYLYPDKNTSFGRFAYSGRKRPALDLNLQAAVTDSIFSFLHKTLTIQATNCFR